MQGERSLSGDRRMETDSLVKINHHGGVRVYVHDPMGRPSCVETHTAWIGRGKRTTSPAPSVLGGVLRRSRGLSKPTQVHDR